MRLGRAIISLLLAILWLGMPVHCKFEVLSAAAMFHCGTGADCGGSSDSDCQGDFCSSIESASYLFSRADDFLMVPVWSVASLLEELSVLPEPMARLQVDLVPLPRSCWQFVYRAAGSPRAPSIQV